MGVIEAVTAVGNAVAEVFKFLQTPQGQEFLMDAKQDRAKFEKTMNEVGAWFTKLVTGKLAI